MRPAAGPVRGDRGSRGVTGIVTPRGHAVTADSRCHHRTLEQRMSQPRERGSLTLLLAVMFVALLALAGIVIDGGAKLTAAENATAIAQEAARAGAGMVSQPTAYTKGSFVVDQSQAVQAAEQYLSQPSVTGAGYQGSVTREGTQSIQVTVTFAEPTRVLSIIGIDRITGTGTATANLVSGVTGPGR
jgi:Flp pilus assembly protein TadG